MKGLVYSNFDWDTVHFLTVVVENEAGRTFFSPSRSVVVWIMIILVDTIVLEALEFLSFRGRQHEAACTADSGKSAETDNAQGCSNTIEAYLLVGVHLR